MAPKPAKSKSTKDAEVQTSLSATDNGESLVAKSSPPKEKRTSDESVDGAELDEKDRRLKEAEVRHSFITALMVPNIAQGCFQKF